jgi:hypothetical protein
VARTAAGKAKKQEETENGGISPKTILLKEKKE